MTTDGGIERSSRNINTVVEKVVIYGDIIGISFIYFFMERLEIDSYRNKFTSLEVGGKFKSSGGRLDKVAVVRVDFVNKRVSYKESSNGRNQGDTKTLSYQSFFEKYEEIFEEE